MRHLAIVRTRVEKDIIIRIKRILKGRGKIYVSVNQEVTPSDIIGSGQISSGFRSLNLADLLSVAPDKVEKYLKKSLGQRVYKEELLAYNPGGLFKGRKIVTSPTDGVFDFLNPRTGEVRLTFLPKKVDLPAGVFGIVDHVNYDHGQVIIRTQASKIQGVFGSGRIRDGILAIVGRRDGLINGSDIAIKLEGHIVVGGSLVFKDGITEAISSNISGIITGGINAADYRGMAGGRLTFPHKLENDIGISLVVSEGFGSIPIGEDIYQLLMSYDGKFVSIDGNKAVINLPSFESKSITRIRNTSLPPILEVPADLLEEEPRIKIGEMKQGNFVRVVGNAYAGEQGRVLLIDKTESLLPSGVKSFMVTLETRRRKIQVPVANLEIISGA